MNINDDLSAWRRVTDAARRAVDGRPETAPYGFATRVAALAMATGGREQVSLFTKIALRALGVACLLAVLSTAFNLGPVLRTIDEDVETLDEPMTMMSLMVDSDAPLDHSS